MFPDIAIVIISKLMSGGVWGKGKRKVKAVRESGKIWEWES